MGKHITVKIILLVITIFTEKKNFIVKLLTYLQRTEPKTKNNVKKKIHMKVNKQST